MPRTVRLLLTAALALSAVTGLATVAVPAGAATAWPSAPASVHVSAVGHDWATVSAARASNVTAYRVFVSPDKNDLWGATLKTVRPARVSLSSLSPTITVRNLTYRSGYYYYRYQTVHGTNTLSSAILAFSLRPTAPASPVVHTGPHGLYLTWTGGVGSTSVIVQSTNWAMTAGRHVYVVRGLTNQFTPFGMTRGVRYYFRVKAYNGATPSTYSASVSGVFQTVEQSVRVMSYNILTLASDGQTVAGSLTQAPWTQRRIPMAALIKGANPDVIGVQEGGSPTGGWKSPRQVDTLQSALGSTYTVARTEPRAGEPGYVLTGNYIVYRNTTWAPVGDGGHYLIDGPSAAYNAAWQVLRSRRTGAEVMVVSTHMSKGTDLASCAVRARETTALIAQAASIAAQVRSGGVPIVYTGDYASAPTRWMPDDSPGRLMRTMAHANDSYWAAGVYRNDRWNTMNKYRRVVEVGGTIIDRIFGTAGVAMHYWSQGVHESAGKFLGVIPSDHNPVYADLGIQG